MCRYVNAAECSAQNFQMVKLLIPNSRLGTRNESTIQMMCIYHIFSVLPFLPDNTYVVINLPPSFNELNQFPGIFGQQRIFQGFELLSIR